jgi:hypothetical protein
MDESLRQMLKIPYDRLDGLNAVLLDPDMQVVNNFLEVVQKYGTPEEINRKAAEARKLPNLLKKVEQTKPEYLKDLQWLVEQRDCGPISVADCRRRCWVEADTEVR